MLNFFTAIIASVEGGFGSFTSVRIHLGKAEYCYDPALSKDQLGEILSQKDRDCEKNLGFLTS